MAIIFGAYETGLCGSSEGKGTEDTFQKVNYFIDFSDYESGSVENWLRKKGFKFERDARDRKKLDLDISEKGLTLEAKRPMFGIMVNEGVDLGEFTAIRIEWGINRLKFLLRTDWILSTTSIAAYVRLL